MQSLGVALVLEFKAKDKTEEIQIRSWNQIKMDESSVMKFKSEVEIKEIKMDELSVLNFNSEVEIKDWAWWWKLKSEETMGTESWSWWRNLNIVRTEVVDV